MAGSGLIMMTTMTMARQQVVYRNIVFFMEKIHTCKPTFWRCGKVLYETKGVPSRSNIGHFCYQGGSFY